MTALRPALMLAALLLVALGYARLGVKSALAPLCAVCTAALLAAACGILGLLPLAGWLFYGLAAACGLYFAYGLIAKRAAPPRPGPGFWVFALGGVWMLVLLAAARPMLLSWDEFSTWGTAAKLMKLYNELYTTAPSGFAWPTTQPPATMGLVYLTQFWGAGFVEWQVYAGINFLLLACVAALCVPLEEKRGALALPLALMGFFTPFLFTMYRMPVQVASPWLDSLVDVPMGMTMGAALAAWLATKEADGSPRKARAARLLPVALALATLTMCKDMGLALALVAAALVLVSDISAPRPKGRGLWAHWRRPLARFGILAACVVGPFALWLSYTSSVFSINRLELGGVSNAGMLDLPRLFLADLASPEKSEHFRSVTGGMLRFFATSASTMLGTGAMLAAGITAMGLLAAFLWGPGAGRRRCLSYSLFSLLGFLPYFWLITATYLYIFRPEQALESVERYLSPYYIGWFLGALALLATAAAHAPKGRRAAPLALAAAALLCAVRVFSIVPAGYTIVGVRADEYNVRRAFQRDIEALTATLSPGGKTFLISTDDDGAKWFRHHYAFLPYQMDYSYGGGEFALRELQPSGETKVTHIGPRAWRRHLRETGCTTVYIDHADEAFRREYGKVFADDMRGYFEEGIQLYNVESIDGKITLTPQGGAS